jgi:phosphohistidine swiveling domain-containing protein
MRPLSADLLEESATYGNKASGLARLLSMGRFAIPDAFVISGDDSLDEGTLWDAARRWIGQALDDKGRARLAVRSSAPSEDRPDASQAGRFKSVLGDFERSDLMQAVKAVQWSGDAQPLPVIVQVRIDAEFSGIAFSCDPVSLERGQYVLSFVKGRGDDLASGKATGSLLVLRSASEDRGVWPASPTTLCELLSALGAIETELKGPADVEWVIDKDGKLWILQARPVVLPQSNCVDARKGEEFRNLPGVVAGHPKIRLRVAANQRSVPMSTAAILTALSQAPVIEFPPWIPSRAAAGLSIVLLHPYRAGEKIQREFAQVDDMNVPFFTLGCRRYSIRRYPSHEAVEAVANDVIGRGLRQSWMATIVIQEIYDAEATGIVRRLGDEFIVELAVGHFVPKGVVDPSRLVISASGAVVESHRVEQETAYRFINGHVVTEHPVEQQLQLSDAEIATAVGHIRPLFEDYPDAALEFGILRDRKGDVSGYVIDMAEGDSHSCASQLTRELISMGVVSPGRVTGKVLRISNDANAYGTESNLDVHLMEGLAVADETLDELVIVADRASIDLLPLVTKCSKNIAFVFRHASLLAHLCVILRERGITAMVVEDPALFDQLSEGSMVTVDATDGDNGGPQVTKL